MTDWIKNIDHMAIKISDLPQVCAALENLGLACQKVGQRDEVGMRIAWLKHGQTTVELLEVTDSSSPIFNDPPGLHHLGLKVKNLEDTYRMMEKNDQYKIEGKICQGIHSRIFFFRLTGQKEILFECSE